MKTALLNQPKHPPRRKVQSTPINTQQGKKHNQPMPLAKLAVNRTIRSPFGNC
ncbi:hypothetical protein [Moraxella catarrhalis]|uniref:hypothetical protein n=1 Tax=Moraxella catarrhalis TaxID=480 RepID=UPI0007F47FB0|nr:hypothetical protein [Moraxella catarrhalis]OAV05081.1 hypothetical protein AO379_1814 [Moraxella catarrhalis]